jgi:cytochrome c oxidase cbb3-type subunit 3
MTTRSSRWGSAAIVGAAAVLIVAACEHTPGDLAASGAAPAITTPVGPVPGPVENPPRRQNPYEASAGAAAEGRELFVQMNCSGCHGGRAGGGMGPSLRDVDWLYGSTPAQVFSSIAEGRAHGMPAWGTHLPNDQIWKLVTYIQTLRTPMEPQPPQ